MNKMGVTALLACGLATGCNAELRTADYLYPTKNAVGLYRLSPEDSFSVQYANWNKGKLIIQSYAVFSGKIMPMSAIKAQMTESEVVDERAVKTDKYPLVIDANKAFPEGSGAKIISTGEAFKIGHQEFEPCIRTKSQSNETVYCKGIGEVWSRVHAVGGKVFTTEMIDLRQYEKADPIYEQSTLALMLDYSVSESLPAQERETYAKWKNGSCSKHITERGVSIGFAQSSQACSCLYRRNKEAVESIVEFPDTLIPLGTGSMAQQFEIDAVSCIREVTGFKGPLM